MALVTSTWMKPSCDEKTSQPFSSSSPPGVDCIQLFFRLDDAKNVVLNMQSNSEIREVKKMLIQKLVLLDAATQKTLSQNTGRNNNFTTVMSVLWLAVSLFNTRAARWNDLVFLYNGKLLDDDGCLDDYLPCGGARHSYSVHASLRLKGGCFMISASVFCMLCTAVIGSTCTCGLSLVAVPFLLPLLFVLPLFCL